MGETTTQDQEVLVEIDGPGVEPNTIDPALLLELAGAYVSLLLKGADQLQKPLALRGVAVRNKCAAVVVSADDIEAARSAADFIQPFIANESRPVPGLVGHVDRIQRALRSMPDKFAAKVAVGARWERTLEVGERSVVVSREMTSFRAYLMRIGGKAPVVLLSVPLEGTRPVALNVTVQLAESVCRYLYKWLEVDALVERDDEHRIIGGKMTAFQAVEQTSSFEAWQQWFEANFADWDLVEDIELELGRSGN